MRQARVSGAWNYVPVMALLGVLAIWAVVAESDFSFYWRDPAAIVNSGPWIGLFSNIGNFLWWMAGVVAVFSGLLLRGVPGKSSRSAFLLCWGTLTGGLALDDFFMIHEWVVPTYLPFSENVFYGVYILIGILLAVLFKEEMRASPYPIFLLSLACLGGSVVFDLIGTQRFIDVGLPVRFVWNLEYVVEDGLKLTGIIAWVHYFSLTSFQALRPYVTGITDTETRPLPAHRRKQSKVR